MANIRDIARITGYSVSTISRVINHFPYVEDAKRQKVLKVMKDLNYVPNNIARKLSSGKNHTIGVIVPFTSHPYFDQLVGGILEKAFVNNYRVTLLPTHYDKDIEKQYLNSFAAKEFDGLIVTSRANSVKTLLTYQKYGQIVFCTYIPRKDVACVYIDRKNSVTEALNYLKDQGVTRLGATLGRNTHLSYNSKITLRLCHKLFQNFDENNIYWNCLNSEDGYEAGKFFQDKQVDGIFSNTDLVAAGIVKAYGTHSFPPLIGRDNLLISDFLKFPTIR